MALVKLSQLVRSIDKLVPVRVVGVILIGLAFAAAPGVAQTNPFAGGWVLNPAGSNLRFQSVKDQTKVESSEFASFAGSIAEDGTATIRLQMDSVDTKIDLRNVRMRFLFFETFEFPEAVITARLDPVVLADLPTVRRKTITLPYSLTLHGVMQQRVADVTVTLLTDELVVVSTSAPISVAAGDFNLENGVRKLEEAANVAIVPSGTVTFEFMFARDTAASPDTTTKPALPASPQPAATAGAALDAGVDLDLEACVGRFEILSRTDNINFRSARADLETSSFFLLDSIVEIIRRCPDLRIEVGGHTDDLGSNRTNQRLSERRAATVVNYLTSKGAISRQITSRGYGEDNPIVENSSAENRARNRRIEFTVGN